MKPRIKKSLRNYFITVGVFAHFALIGALVLEPSIGDRAYRKATDAIYAQLKENEIKSLIKFESVAEELEAVFKPWKPDPAYPAITQTLINGLPAGTLLEAVAALKPGDTLEIAQGVYNTPFKISTDNVTLVGRGHVVFQNAAYGRKAFIVNQANNVVIRNIECRGINVRDRNGACVRQEGAGLTLEHVYFHHSENGVLENGRTPGPIVINDSRFERLGKAGRAHGIYTGKAPLHIFDSLFIAAKDEGHAIKSRGPITEIRHSIVASLSSVDSRLLDVSNGGQLIVTDSILQQGPMSANQQMIGFAMEGRKHKDNSITLTDNLVLFDRIGKDVFLGRDKEAVAITIRGNLFVGEAEMPEIDSSNLQYESRDAIPMVAYPYLPDSYCLDPLTCMIKPQG